MGSKPPKTGPRWTCAERWSIPPSPRPGGSAGAGGSLPNSTWGHADMAYPTFEWIAAHPWIQPLNGADLMTFPVKAQYVPPQSTAPESSPWLDAFQTAPDNVITQSAWQMYLTLTTPSTDTQLKAMRADYLGQVGELLAAARWAENPSAQADCVNDLDADGQTDCILSNQKYYAILDASGPG